MGSLVGSQQIQTGFTRGSGRTSARPAIDSARMKGLIAAMLRALAACLPLALACRPADCMVGGAPAAPDNPGRAAVLLVRLAWHVVHRRGAGATTRAHRSALRVARRRLQARCIRRRPPAVAQGHRDHRAPSAVRHQGGGASSRQRRRCAAQSGRRDRQRAGAARHPRTPQSRPATASWSRATAYRCAATAGAAAHCAPLPWSPPASPAACKCGCIDPAMSGKRAGLGACTGDSGAPGVRDTAGSFALIGVVSWSTGRQQYRRLRRPHRRDAAHALPRLDRRNRGQDGKPAAVKPLRQILAATAGTPRPVGSVRACARRRRAARRGRGCPSHGTAPRCAGRQTRSLHRHRHRPRPRAHGRALRRTGRNHHGCCEHAGPRRQTHPRGAGANSSRFFSGRRADRTVGGSCAAQARRAASGTLRAGAARPARRDPDRRALRRCRLRRQRWRRRVRHPARGDADGDPHAIRAAVLARRSCHPRRDHGAWRVLGRFRRSGVRSRQANRSR